MRTCAWLVNHPVLPAQRASLAAYRIVVVPQKPRFHSAADAWLVMCTTVGGVPDLIVASLPAVIYRPFARKAMAAAVPVIRSKMLPPARNEWAGYWLQVARVHRSWIEWRLWEPQEVMGS